VNSRLGRQAYFALCPAGWACWSRRLYDAIFAAAVPVVVADPVAEPFERFLDWRGFAVGLGADEVRELGDAF
jgi:hypothetical protein